MKSFTPKALISISLLLLTTHPVFAEPIAAPIPADTAALNTTTDKGCYKSAQPLEDQGPYTFQTTGWCQKICVGLSKSVMALYKGSNCYCGNVLPAASQKVSNDQCQEPCDGFPDVKCGGKKAFSVFLTGLLEDGDVQTYNGAITGTDSATPTGPSPSVITQAGQTVVVTEGSDSKSGGPNKAGIAAGVVVGVVAIGAIIGGVIFFLKYKKRKSVEDEYRRNAAISSFVSGGKSQPSGSMSDSRLDPSIASHRRQSNGSIADDQDFSRRILKVTNPDGHY